MRVVAEQGQFGGAAGGDGLVGEILVAISAIVCAKRRLGKESLRGGNGMEANLFSLTLLLQLLASLEMPQLSDVKGIKIKDTWTQINLTKSVLHQTFVASVKPRQVLLIKTQRIVYHI